MMAAQLTINDITDILCVGATKLGVLSTLVMAEFWPNKRFVITDIQSAINRWLTPNLTVFEPGLTNILMARTAAPPNGNVTFQAINIALQVYNCQMVMIATDVKTKKRDIGANKKLNLTSWDQAVIQVLIHVQQPKAIVIKCALPHDVITALTKLCDDVSSHNNQFANGCSIFWVPEFFSAGTALYDLRHPSRVVISQCRAGLVNVDVVADLYRMAPNWLDNNDILMHGHHASAAIGVMGANVMLAFRAILMELMTQFCESITEPANIEEVKNIITTDARIGDQFLDITAGFGGRALLRDLMFFKHLAELTGNKNARLLFDTAIKCHDNYKEKFVSHVLHELNSLEQKIIVILGFSYKPNTSDVDNSAAIHICNKLCLEKAMIRIHDPRAPAADILDCFSRTYTQGNNARITVHQLNNQLWQGVNAICFLQNWE